MDDSFFPITEGALVKRLELVVGNNIRRLPGGTYELCRLRGRHAVPAISASHFTRENEARISEAFRLEPHPSLYAVVLEPLKNQPAVFFTAPTKEGLRGFQRACSHFNYALCAPDASSMVVCTTDDYLVYVGSQLFVERCAGADEPSALRSFREYADNPSWPDQKVRHNLQSVYVALAEQFPKADEGTFVPFLEPSGTT